MASLTRVQQRELIEKIRRAIRPSPYAATESIEVFMGEITAVCDGYTQALTDLEAAEQREKELLSVIFCTHAAMVIAGERRGPCCCIYCEEYRGALPTASAPPQGQE